MKTYSLIQGLNQQYEKYTDEDFSVWKILFERQMKILRNLASDEYLEGLERIGFTGSKIPDFREVNRHLAECTGWQIVVVPGIISEPDFFSMLSNKQFPATSWLRKMSELDYLPEPDMFHDVFGHLPLLTNKLFCDFYFELGQLALNYLDDVRVMAMLGRLYWFTIEFGLIMNKSEVKIYGAGIISSHGETNYSISTEPMHLPFNVREIMSTPFENDHIQEKYFVISSFKQLYNSMEAIREVVREGK